MVPGVLVREKSRQSTDAPHTDRVFKSCKDYMCHEILALRMCNYCRYKESYRTISQSIQPDMRAQVSQPLVDTGKHYPSASQFFEKTPVHFISQGNVPFH